MNFWASALYMGKGPRPTVIAARYLASENVDDHEQFDARNKS
jgi:hypothetical protein